MKQVVFQDGAGEFVQDSVEENFEVALLGVEFDDGEDTNDGWIQGDEGGDDPLNTHPI